MSIAPNPTARFDLRQGCEVFQSFGFKSGREAKNAARSAGVKTLALVWRDTFGVGGAKVPGGFEPPLRSVIRLGGGFMGHFRRLGRLGVY